MKTVFNKGCDILSEGVLVRPGSDGQFRPMTVSELTDYVLKFPGNMGEHAIVSRKDDTCIIRLRNGGSRLLRTWIRVWGGNYHIRSSGSGLP